MGAGVSLLSPAPRMCSFPYACTPGMPVQVGMGMRPAQLKDKQGYRLLLSDSISPWAGGHKGGAQSQ